MPENISNIVITFLFMGAYRFLIVLTMILPIANAPTPIKREMITMLEMFSGIQSHSFGYLGKAAKYNKLCNQRNRNENANNGEEMKAKH